MFFSKTRCIFILFHQTSVAKDTHTHTHTLTYTHIHTQIIYTVNHKKRDILFLTITLANLNRFYSFYVTLIVKKFYMRI